MFGLFLFFERKALPLLFSCSPLLRILSFDCSENGFISFFFGQSESCLLWHLSLVATVEHSICRLRFLFSWVLILSWDVVWSLFAGLARFLCNEISLSVEKKIFTIFLNKITSHSISLMNYCALKVMIKYVTLKKLISGEFLLKLSLLKSFINI